MTGPVMRLTLGWGRTGRHWHEAGPSRRVSAVLCGSASIAAMRGANCSLASGSRAARNSESESGTRERKPRGPGKLDSPNFR